MANALTTSDRLQYIADADGRPQAVVVPIDVWDSIRTQVEGEDAWPSAAMRQRIEQSLACPADARVSFDETMKQVGLTQREIDAAD